MHGPALVGWLLVALCGGVGGYCLRLVRDGPPWWRRAAAAEGVMSLGMAAMAVPVPGDARAALGVLLMVVFAAVTAWCAALLRAGAAHRAHHVVEALAMVYMGLAMAAASAGHGGHGGEEGGTAGGVAPVTWLLLAYFALHVLRSGPRLAPVSAAVPVASGGGAAAPSPSPEVRRACRVALSVGMLAMLLTL
jgi:uncharacterized protein DUF5134